MILAIDTATDWAGVALYDEGAHQIRYEVTWWARRRHTTTLLPRVDEMLTDQSLDRDAITGVAVAIGPGSYTGLRVGLSLAKGLVQALHVPLVGIPTLDVVAYPHRGRQEHICTIIQAGRTRVCWALYPPGHPSSPADGYHLDEIETVARALARHASPVFVVGEITPAQREALARAGDHVRVGTPADGLRRPGFLAEMGYHAFQAGRQDDPATLSPIYLRHPGSSGP